MAGGPADAFAFCRALVDDRDSDRALALRFAPAERQDALAALAAFDIEIGDVPARVSEPMPGEIRLQWWRDRVSEAGGGDGSNEPGAPVADALVRAIRAHDLPRAALDRYLEARIFDLYADTMDSRASLEGYAGETASALIMLAALILDDDAASQAAELAGHAGVALTIANLLEKSSVHPERSHIFIPEEIFAAVGVSRSEWARDPQKHAGIGAALEAMAREHIGVLERGWAALPRAVRPAFLPALLVPRQIDAAQRAIAAGSAPSALSPLRRSWIFWRAMSRRQQNA